MSQSCSGKCQTFISRRPKMGSNFVHYILNIIKSEYMEIISGQSAARMPVQAMHPERFSKHFLQLFSVRSLHNNLKISSRKNFGSLCASFRKWFSNRNAPTRAYIDEPRPRQRSSSLAGKIIHPSYPCLIICFVHGTHIL